MTTLAWSSWRSASGPAVAKVFRRLYALISLGAWLSLGAQQRVLIGSHGLLPVGEFMASVQADPELSVLDLPTVFWHFHSDFALCAGIAVGVLAALAALLDVAPRLGFALSTILYLSFATVARNFLSFQWDNLLLECGLLAILLPTNRPAPLVHLLLRLVLFKLYFESGIAKWQSPLRDWQDGSAMTYYYETAPLPTWLGFYAHHLPRWWHLFESRATLVLELAVPLAIFGPRRARLLALGAFTLFQVANAATANYGFFCYLAAALGVFLLDDGDVTRAGARLAPLVPEPFRRIAARWREAISRAPAAVRSGPRRRARLWAGRAGAVLWVALSLLDGLDNFTENGGRGQMAGAAVAINRRFRLVNSYHLFSSITRERIEPEFQTLDTGEPSATAQNDDDDDDDDNAWTPHDLWHKAGDIRRAPGFVAPYQPRVDFQLWFYGLAFRRRPPNYVTTLVERMCGDAAAVQPLFRAPLPSHPVAVRLVFWQYRFATTAEARETGDWWRRTRLATSRAIPCARSGP